MAVKETIEGGRYPCCERCIYHETESFKFGIDWTKTAKWTRPREVPCDYCNVEKTYFVEAMGGIVNRVASR